MSFNCLSSYMTHPLTTTLPAPVGQQFDKWQRVTCKANIPYGWLAQDGQTHLQQADVVDSTSWYGKPLTLWFCGQSRRSESFNDKMWPAKMWPANYKGLLHWSWSPLFEKLVSNTLLLGHSVTEPCCTAHHQAPGLLWDTHGYEPVVITRSKTFEDLANSHVMTFDFTSFPLSGQCILF